MSDAYLRKAAPPNGVQESLRLAQVVSGVRPLFKAGVLQGSIATIYKSRLEGMRQADISRWKAALQKQCKFDDVSKNWIVALEMLQVESFWTGAVLDEQSFMRSIARLESILPGKLDEWRPEAAFCVDPLRVEGLFVDDSLDVALFDRALPLAKQQFAARNAGLPKDQ